MVGDPFVFDSVELSTSLENDHNATYSSEGDKLSAKTLDLCNPFFQVDSDSGVDLHTACQEITQQTDLSYESFNSAVTPVCRRSSLARTNFQLSSTLTGTTAGSGSGGELEECRPLLTRSSHSEISMFDSDSDSNSSAWPPILSSVSKLFRKGSKSASNAQSEGMHAHVIASSTSMLCPAETSTIYANVLNKRQILHVQNENKVDVLLYERNDATTCVLAGTLDVLLAEYTRPASKITGRKVCV